MEYLVSRQYPYHKVGEDAEEVAPAEACGIKIEGNNKWLTLIQNASNEQNHGC